MLRNAQSLGFEKTGEQKTDFKKLSGSFTVTKGVLDNRDLKMQAALLQLSGKGLIPIPARLIDYEVEAKLVASLEGQPSQNALAGLPIPIKVKGKWDNPSISTDWRSVFAVASTIPGRVASMPVHLLGLGKSLGVLLPLPSLTDSKDKSKGVGGILGGVFRMMPGVAGSRSREPEKPKQQPTQEEQKQ
jgi:AsmA protein